MGSIPTLDEYSPPPGASNGSAGAADSKWKLVERLAGSNTFQKAFRLRQFFLHVAQCALDNRPEEATEQQIGIHVFGRVAGYNPNEDNIVRSQARFLRLKLEHYFATEGKDEPYFITIPKGQYLPVFEAREMPPSPCSPPPPTPEALAEPKRDRVVLMHLFAALTLVFIGTTLWTGSLWLQSRQSRGAGLAPSFVAFWSTLLGHDSSTLVVSADETYALLQQAARRDIPLSSYLSSDYPKDAERILNESGLGKVFPESSYPNLTGFSSVGSAFNLAGVGQFTNTHIVGRFARGLNPRDVRSVNLILIGSHHANPWVELFEREVNFAWEYDYQRMENYCNNRSPHAGEERSYYAAKAGSEKVVYGGLAFLAASGRHVLVVAGTSMEGVEMASDFITNPAVCAKFLDRISDGGSTSKPHAFEVLLRADSLAGGLAVRPRVVAWRLVPPEESEGTDSKR